MCDYKAVIEIDISALSAHCVLLTRINGHFVAGKRGPVLKFCRKSRQQWPIIYTDAKETTNMVKVDH